MDGPVLVHALVDVLEEVKSQPVAQAPLGADRRAVLRPGGVQWRGRGVAEAVAAIVGVKRGVEEEDAVRECVREISGGRVEDALGGGACGPKRPRATPRAKLRWSVAGSGS